MKICPEYPRWYMKKERYTDAFSSFELQATRDPYQVHCQLVEEMAVLKGSND